MEIAAAVFGTALIVLVLWEGFETIVLPRRVTRRFRLTRLYYRRTWRLWLVMVRNFLPARQRETPRRISPDRLRNVAQAW